MLDRRALYVRYVRYLGVCGHGDLCVKCDVCVVCVCAVSDVLCGVCATCCICGVCAVCTAYVVAWSVAFRSSSVVVHVPYQRILYTVCYTRPVHVNEVK